MSSARCGDGSSADWSSHRSTRRCDSSPSRRRRHSRSRSRSRQRGTHKHSRVRSQSPRRSHRSSHNSNCRSKSHHDRHSDYDSPSRRHAHYSRGGSHRNSNMPQPHSRSQAASNRHSLHLEQWGPSNSTTTGRWSHDGYLQTSSDYPSTNATPTLSLEEGHRLATQGSHCAGCAHAPLAEIMPDRTPSDRAAPPALPPRSIAACCSDECATTWCGVDITYDPPRFRTAADLAELRRPPPQPHARFRGMHRLYAGCNLMVATTPADLDTGLHLLELSMADEVVAIDLEWKADTDKDQDNRVALIQLASSSMVLLIKTTGLDYMPDALEAFLREEGRTFLGLGWSSADEKKMRTSFSFGRADFSRFIDLQDCFFELGYPRNQVNITGITSNCFGLTVPSMRCWEIMTGWDTPHLSVRQTVYAARDALLTAYAYRQLRAWHEAVVDPALETRICEACGRAFGVPTEWLMGPTPIRCLDARCCKAFTTVQALADHAGSTHHEASHVQCYSCNRLCCVE